MYAIMLECWCEKASSRPAFHNLVNMLQGLTATSDQPSALNNAASADETSSQEISDRNGSRGVALNDTYMSNQPENGTHNIVVNDTYLSNQQQPNFVLGDRVIVAGFNSEGTVRFVGPHKVKATLRVGVELDKQVGKNNGTIGGNTYFHAKERHGILCLPTDCTLIFSSGGGGSGDGSVAETVLDEAPNFASLKRHTSTSGSKDGWKNAKPISVPAIPTGTTSNAAHLDPAPSMSLGDESTEDLHNARDDPSRFTLDLGGDSGNMGMDL